MKNLFIASLFIIQYCLAFAQNCCTGDSSFREIQFPLTENDTRSLFYYFNNEWLAIPDLNIVHTDSIQKLEIKNDDYGNRALFFTVSPEYFIQLKSETHKLPVNVDPICEFPGGNARLKDWLDANILIPEGYKGCERVVVGYIVQPDGTVTDPRILKPSKNDAANAEALRLVNALPKFRIKYNTPEKNPVRIALPIMFKEPGMILIRGNESSFIEHFPSIENKIRQFYETSVFYTSENPDFKISEICTADFIKRLTDANDTDAGGYATWLLRSGMQDGQDVPSEVLTVIPGSDNTVIVSWNDMGIKGYTTFRMVESDGQWKIDDATVPAGFNPL